MGICTTAGALEQSLTKPEFCLECRENAPEVDAAELEGGEEEVEEGDGEESEVDSDLDSFIVDDDDEEMIEEEGNDVADIRMEGK